MSLTEYLTSKKCEDFIKFQESIKSITPRRNEFKVLESDGVAFDTKTELLVPYNLDTPQEARIVGTAFDYLARFRVAQIVRSNSSEVLDGMIAENFFARFKEGLSSKVLKNLNKRFLEIKNNIKRIIDNNIQIDDSIIDDVFTLTILEHCWRGSKLPNNINELFNKPSEPVVRDLKCLMKVFESNFVNKVIKPNSRVKYNPSFGKSSLAIGGADADIYIDGTLYDFKCTKESGYKGMYAQQILGYYILDILAKKDEHKAFTPSLIGHDIDRLAIYSARVGEVYYFDTKSINKAELENVVSQIENILFKKKLKPIKKQPITKKKKRKKDASKAVLVAVIVLGLLGIIKFSQDYLNKNDIANNIEGSSLKGNNSSISSVTKEDIKEDFKQKRLEAQEVLPMNLGFFKYYNTLINNLRQYDVSNLENAYAVYELSDELLNSMYQEFKTNWSEESFNKLKEEQIIWVNNKLKLESEMKDNELAKYQKFISITLDRCEEWTEYYR